LRVKLGLDTAKMLRIFHAENSTTCDY